MSEEDVALVLDEAKEAMEKSIRSFRIELQKVRTGRANPAILDGVQVDYYGTPTPLNQLANLSAPDPRLIVVSPYDKGSLGEIERAILKADLGLTPANDGKLVRIPIPPLTEERRKELVKVIHKMCEDHKITARNIRRDSNDLLKSLKKDGDISEDDAFKAQDQVQKITDEHIKLIDDVCKDKEKEILEF